MTEAKTPIEPDFFEISEVPPVINSWDPKKAMKRMWLLEAQVSKLIEAARKQGNMMDMMAMELASVRAHAATAAVEKRALPTPKKKTPKKGTKKNAHRNNDEITGRTTAGRTNEGGTSAGSEPTDGEDSAA